MFHLDIGRDSNRWQPPRMLYRLIRAAAVAAVTVCPLAANAWDYEGHRVVNELALASLPKEFPDFVKTAENAERIAFLAGEPDRWRNTPDLPLKHFNAPDHFFDIEDLAPHGLTLEGLSPFRYEFTAQLAAGRVVHPDALPAIDPKKNSDETRQLVGFLPWAMTEQYGKLKSGFSYLKAFEQHGTPEEIANAKANVVYIMGVMGHYVGDAAQPLHTTKNYNGWVGENPNGFTTSKGFHALIDGGFNRRTGMSFEGLKGSLRPAKPLFETVAPPTKPHEVFPVMIDYLKEGFSRVEPLYRLEKDGKLDPSKPGSQEGRAFLDKQLLSAGQKLGDLWLTAWREAPEDKYLTGQLITRKNGGRE
jgi:hypothetical protein